MRQVMGRIEMQAFLAIIVIASCNAELHPKETAGLHPKKTGLPAAESRIVGGTNTTIEKYPFAVQSYQLICELKEDGTVDSVLQYKVPKIDKGQNKLRDYTIRASTSMLNSGGSVHTITAIKVHEQFNFTSFEHNLAVVLMNTPVDMSTSVARPVFFNDQDSVVPDNSFVTAVGWGWTKVPKNEETNCLHEVTVPTMNLDTCKARFMNTPIQKISSNSICTGPGKGPCFADGGGALLYEEIIVGITSSKYSSCSNPEFPIVYVKVASYTNWIIDKINYMPICSSKLQNVTDQKSGRVDSPSKQACSKVGAMTLLTPILYLILSV